MHFFVLNLNIIDMKHYFLLLLILPAILYAGPISEKKAEKIVLSFFQSKTLTKSAPNAKFKLVLKGGEQQNLSRAAADKNATFYIFNREDRPGYAIISGDDALAPIVGYSHSDNFDTDNMPTALKHWLEEYSLYVKDIWEKGNTAVNTERGIIYPTTDPIEPMIKTKWGQGNPYYGKCPTIQQPGTGTVTQTLAGCTATALAQIMYYHKYPASGENELSYYDQSSDTSFDVDFSKSTYDWDNMLYSYTDEYNQTQADAVAKLMLDAGVACHSSYKGGSTSGQFSRTSLEKYFKYECNTLLRRYISSAKWMEIIQNELKAGRPVLYGGYNGVNHVFILDGIDDSNNIHINWGWNGSNDGYYDINFCKPESDTDSGYKSGHIMIYGIQPRSTVEKPYKEQAYMVGYPAISSANFIKFHGITTNSFDPVKYEFSPCLIQNGEIKEFIKDQNGQSIIKKYNDPLNAFLYHETISFNQIDLSKIANGTYDLGLAARKSETTEWSLTQYADFLYSRITMNNGNINIENADEATTNAEFDIKKLSITDVKPASELIGSSEFYLTITLRNENTAENYGLGWSGISCNVNFINTETNKSYQNNISFECLYSGSVETRTFLFNNRFNNLPKIPSGIYKLQFNDVNGVAVASAEEYQVTLSGETDFPVLNVNQPLHLPRSIVNQDEKLKTIIYFYTSNKVFGNIALNVYVKSKASEDAPEILLYTIPEVDVAGQGNLYELQHSLYPLEGEYEIFYRYMCTGGERTPLNPSLKNEILTILPPRNPTPHLKVKGKPQIENVEEIGIHEVANLSFSISNESAETFEGTVNAYFYNKSAGLYFTIQSETTTITSQNNTTVTFNPVFPITGDYEVYLKCQPKSFSSDALVSAILDNDNYPTHYKVKITENGPGAIDNTPLNHLSVNIDSDLGQIRIFSPNDILQTVQILSATSGNIFAWKNNIKEQETVISTSGLPSGVYILKVTNRGEMKTVKFVMK